MSSTQMIRLAVGLVVAAVVILASVAAGVPQAVAELVRDGPKAPATTAAEHADGAMLGGPWRVTLRDGRSATGTVMLSERGVRVLSEHRVLDADLAAIKRLERTK